MWIWGAALIGLAGLAFVRLAPLDVGRWHPLDVAVQAEGDYPGTGRFLAVRRGSAADFAALDRAARAWPRTKVVAGSLEAAQITYETRTRLVGFPDYTTVTLKDGQMQVFGRLRFGHADMGVNRRRVLAWLAAAGL